MKTTTEVRSDYYVAALMHALKTAWAWRIGMIVMLAAFIVLRTVDYITLARHEQEAALAMKILDDKLDRNLKAIEELRRDVDEMKRSVWARVKLAEPK